MTRFVFSLALIAAACTLPVLPAHAQSRVFVAAQGSDSNPCTFAAPCRTFQHAHDVVAANGEINVLDPAGYGALTISKAISIQGHDFSGISAPSGTAITINAGASDKVNLRGLIIDGVGAGINGIVFNSGKSLVIEKTAIRNFTGSGILFGPTLQSGSLVVSDTTVSDNGANGVIVQPKAHIVAQAVFDHVKAYNNSVSGITFDASSALSIRALLTNCVASDSGVVSSTSIGFHATSGVPNHGTANVKVNRSVATGNLVGLQADQFGQIFVSQTDLEDNNSDWLVTGSGSVLSYSDNYTEGSSPPTGQAFKQ